MSVRLFAGTVFHALRLPLPTDGRLDLHPVARTTGGVGRVGALGDDPFKLLGHCLPVHRLTVTIDMGRIADTLQAS